MRLATTAGTAGGARSSPRCDLPDRRAGNHRRSARGADAVHASDRVTGQRRLGPSVVLFARVRWLSIDPQRRPAPEDVEPTAASVPVAVAKSHGNPPGWPPIGHQICPKVTSLQANRGYRYRDLNLVRAVDGPTPTSAPPRKQNAPSRRITLRPRSTSRPARGATGARRPTRPASARPRVFERAALLPIRAEFLHSPGRTVRNASTRVSPTRRVPRPPNRPTGGGPGEAQPCSRRTRPMSSSPDGVACRRRSE